MSRTTVVIPCFNVDGYLPDAMRSIASQTRPAKEVIIVDDGSRVPVQLPAGWSGPPAKIIRTANRGVSAARNAAIREASGEFIAFLDADDMWRPEKLEEQERALDADAMAVACYTECLDAPGFFRFGPYPPPDTTVEDFIAVLWYGQFFPPSSVAVRKSAIDRVGGFDESLPVSEDLDLWIRLLRQGDFVAVRLPLTLYRQHTAQVTCNLRRRIVRCEVARRTIARKEGELIRRAGIRQERESHAYRNEILLAYFRRQFDVARPLLWRFWLGRPFDLGVLRYAIFSMIPPALIARARGSASPASPDTGVAAPPPRAWADLLQEIRADLR